ncbi:N-acetylmuramoyl-L-alanine amidase [Streptomyces sp. PTM05]|uniref:N-acetylmuramoyl-L-alanine amidase n=1 Tax=Streptantibioticus parmotrematis TaxID=2873249 RepID=A0ABS7QVR5_9ACTN|nr:N-acetylmuramoyl-L-alanine amidase [Streptantibioticus parmotrematis]MBY8887308.1 N-acetylmuramoyl-L-alanine amidase [Streptantibioticus parmotrematis]
MSSPIRRGAAVALGLAALVTACSAQRPPAPPTSPAPRVSPTAHDSGAPPGKPLAGKVVVIDPGHNIGNQHHTAEINRLVDIGGSRKACDTTGTATDAGYPEADFTLDVARRARTLLTALGAKVTFTQDGNRSWGPCVDERARIGNAAHADAAVSIHADGAAVGDRGFHVILPAAVHAGIADTRPIVAPSRTLGTDLRNRFAADTGEPFSTYVGHGTALDVRGDLGGLDLSTVPKVFIECGNMRDPQDAARLTDAAWRQRAARGIADGIAAYLEGSGG